MSYLSFWLAAWVAVALGLERWSEWPLGRRAWPSLLGEAAAVAAGLAAGRWLAHLLPGAWLLGAGLLGYLGLFDLASAGGVAGLRRTAGLGFLARGLLSGFGVGLAGQPSLAAAALMLLGVTAGYVAARLLDHAGKAYWRVLRLAAGLLLFLVSLVTFRAGTSAGGPGRG
ncbi:MAG: hypothetical protein ACM3RP_03935 [Chitinophagales bacterium]